MCTYYGKIFPKVFFYGEVKQQKEKKIVLNAIYETGFN